MVVKSIVSLLSGAKLPRLINMRRWERHLRSMAITVVTILP